VRPRRSSRQARWTFRIALYGFLAASLAAGPVGLQASPTRESEPQALDSGILVPTASTTDATADRRLRDPAEYASIRNRMPVPEANVATYRSSVKPAGSGGAAAPAKSHARATYAEETIRIPILGEARVYSPRPPERARGVIVFVSGDGGWTKGVVEMARRSASKALVVGLSMPAWQKVVEKSPGSCWYPAGELETIAQAVEKKHGFPRYVRPILVGYSSGATVVYGALAQAPPESFAGAISLGFCPDLEVERPLCGRDAWRPRWDERKHLSLLPPRKDLAPRHDQSAKWLALQGQVDQVCDPREVGIFAAEIPAARVVFLPKVGHGFSAPRNWGAEYDRAVDALLGEASAWEPLPAAERHTVPNHSPAEIASRLEALDLPLEIQWPEGARRALVFVSGDGGWADLDQNIAEKLDAVGIAVVGWNTLRYFWGAKSPERFRTDLGRLITAMPPEVEIFAGGYSFGAEVVAVTVARARGGAGSDAAAEERAAAHEDARDGGDRPAHDPLDRIEGLVLLGPGRYATFEVSPLDWIRTSDAPSPHPVGAALAAATMPVLCLDSAQAGDSGCPGRSEGRITRLALEGGHHFGGDYAGIAERIVEFVERAAGKAATAGAGAPR
jgi:type IV secretory pathway VirJ component